MTYVKICGLLPGDDLSFALDSTIKYAGFIFVEKSRRYVAPQAARTLVNGLPGHCTPVGVFVNKPVSEMLSTVDAAQISHVQLHGNESPDTCSDLRNAGMTVWKAIRVYHDDIRNLPDQVSAYLDVCDGILFDAAPPNGVEATVTGGHGRAFSWSSFQRTMGDLLQDSFFRSDAGRQCWVAGGVDESNVRTLLSTLSPFGIDVSSGVELNGRKSMHRIRALIRAVNAHDKQVSVS